jgi:hypothetical protein
MPGPELTQERSGPEMFSEAEGRPRKRLRTAHACDSCRLRKIRCDGQLPCSTCSSTSIECIFGSEAPPKGKGDLILNAVLRIERSLSEMNTKIDSIPIATPPPLAGQNSVSPQTVYSAARPPPGVRSPSASERDISNATLSRLHTSTLESTLAWSNFDHFPGLRLQEGGSIFQLESTRPPLLQRSITVLPYASSGDVDSVVNAFQNNINFWYPTMCGKTRTDLKTRIITGEMDSSTQSCLALLMMALGCASDAISSAFTGHDMRSQESDHQRHQKVTANMYFEVALPKIHLAHAEMSPAATQCLLFAA